MPIRLNLLAEAQAAEEERRRDPVKLAVKLAVLAVLLVVGYLGWLVWGGMQKQKELDQIRTQWESNKAKYDEIKQNDAISEATLQKINKLHNYSTNRFLWGSVLNAFSQVMTNPFATNIQVTRLATEQTFHETKPAKNVTNIAEITKMQVFARDFGSDLDENYNRLKAALGEFSYFKETLASGGRGTRLVDVGQKIVDPARPDRSFANFVLECQFAEKLR